MMHLNQAFRRSGALVCLSAALALLAAGCGDTEPEEVAAPASLRVQFQNAASVSPIVYQNARSWTAASAGTDVAVSLALGVFSTANNINNFKVTVLKADGSVDLVAIPAKGYKAIVTTGTGVIFTARGEDNFGGNFSIPAAVTGVDATVKVIKCVDSYANCKVQQQIFPATGAIAFKISAP